MSRKIGKIFKITIPAVALSVFVLMCLIEVWTRATWDARKGTPGFLIASDRRVEKLSSDYSGWFAGVPVRINHLGFRDTREYDLTKRANTFRILVLGDSVTFGHGALYETTYPYVLEQRLKQWRPEVDWQVWNLGVPGYNTSQELAYLDEVGQTYKPDLVVVGFFFNDIFDNLDPHAESRTPGVTSRIKGYLSVRVYSYHLYKKIYLALSALSSRSEDRQQLTQNLEREENLVQRVDVVAHLAQQTISPVSPIPDRDALTATCKHPEPLKLIKTRQQEDAWLEAVRGFQKVPYPVVFFVNIAPDTCDVDDLFYNGPTKSVNDYFLRMLGAARPTVSSYEAFYRYRPSQMPLAAGHSLGNSNVVKADTLVAFLRDQHLLPEGTAAR